MFARWPLTARIGLGLVLIGACWFGAWAYWAATRIWVPLQVPISLSQGHIRTAEFKINLEVSYELYVEFQPVFDNGSGNGGLRCPALLPRTSWSLLERGQVIASGNGGGSESMGGFFSVGAGTYTLDLRVLDDGSCFNAASPRLFIAAFKYQHPEVDDSMTRASFLSLLLAVTGANLFVRSYSARRHQEKVCSLTASGPQLPLPDAGSGPTELSARRARSGRMVSLAGKGYVRGKSEQSYLWPFQKASWFGLIASFNFPWLVILIVLIVPAFRLPPRGLEVHLLRPGIEAKAQPGLDPLLVRVESDRTIYIGPRRVPSGDFDEALRKGLAIRPPTWPVYVEGDPDLEWGAVAKVIDELRGFHVEVVLLARPRVPSSGPQRPQTLQR